MKAYVLLVFLFVGVIAVLAVPAEVSEEYDYGDDYVSQEDVEQEIANKRADRHRRVTCDLLSFKGIAEHSACAANCLSMGKAGGRCENGVCLCRKTTFMDLWNKRFG